MEATVCNIVPKAAYCIASPTSSVQAYTLIIVTHFDKLCDYM